MERPGNAPIPREVRTVLTVHGRAGWKTAATLIAIWTLALSAFTLVVLSGGWASEAEGNGRVTKYVSRTAGPYEVSLGTAPPDPRVGPLHLTVKLAEADSSEAITGADVVVSGTGPGASDAEIGPLAALTFPATPEDYDLDVEVDREGTWTFTVEVDAPLGRATANFPLDVTRTSPWLGLLTLSLAIVLLLIVGLSMRRYFAARRAQGQSSR